MLEDIRLSVKAVHIIGKKEGFLDGRGAQTPGWAESQKYKELVPHLGAPATMAFGRRFGSIFGPK